MEAAKRFLEKENKIEIDSLPPIFIEPLVSHGLKLELVEPGRLLCSFIVPNRLLEEIEVEAKTLRMGKAIGVVSVEFRKKKSGKIVAQGRHTKYFGISSRL
uniref:Thioesterase domain-containing protein n=1 Tax=Cannabis sativa TaxID=3483 RepID=A0A803RBV1_CANSA